MYPELKTSQTLLLHLDKPPFPGLAFTTSEYTNNSDNIAPAQELAIEDDSTSDGVATTQENHEGDNTLQPCWTFGISTPRASAPRGK